MTTIDNYTQETLEQRRLELKDEIAKSKGAISSRWNALMTPPKPNTKVQQMVVNAERAVAIYDGFMTAYKLMKRFGIFFKSAKKDKRRG